MDQIQINTVNYQMAAGLSAATDAMKKLMDAGVLVTSVSVIQGRGYITCNDASDVTDVKPISSRTFQGTKDVRALLCGCVIDWKTDVVRGVA